MNLTGRTILITGGSSGIGLAFAEKFLALGNTVIITGRKQAKLDAAKAAHPALHTIQCDASDPQALKALSARIDADFPALDVEDDMVMLRVRRDLVMEVARPGAIADREAPGHAEMHDQRIAG